VLFEASGGKPAAVVVASGSELGLALEARTRLEAAGTPTRVVSLPSWYLFARQPRAYRDAVLPRDVQRRVSIEAGTTFGWERWVGPEGHSIGLDRFGASAPFEVLYEKFGLTVEAIVEAAARPG
jgi:transketolase